MKQRVILRRRGPDVLTEELVEAFSGGASFEFDALFRVIYANLRSPNAAHGGVEMLRQRLYDKLQQLVEAGGVDRSGKTYQGNAAVLTTMIEQLAAAHCRQLLSAARRVTPEPAILRPGG